MNLVLNNSDKKKQNKSKTAQAMSAVKIKY